MFDYVTSDPQTREFIRMREKGLRDYNSDVYNAEARGELKKARQMAIGLLKSGVDVNIIAQTSELSIEEIESLKDK
jgi:hypothetical protein